MRGGTPALGLARLRRDGALGERGGSGNRETVTSRARTAWGVTGTQETKKSMATPRFPAVRLAGSTGEEHGL